MLELEGETIALRDDAAHDRSSVEGELARVTAETRARSQRSDQDLAHTRAELASARDDADQAHADLRAARIDVERLQSKLNAMVSAQRAVENATKVSANSEVADARMQARKEMEAVVLLHTEYDRALGTQKAEIAEIRGSAREAELTSAADIRAACAASEESHAASAAADVQRVEEDAAEAKIAAARSRECLDL